MQIKFKAQSFENAWEYGDLVQQNGKAFIITRRPQMRVEVRPETVGQYTNWKDSTGRPIYDGDIVSMKLEDTIDPQGFFWWKAIVRNVRGCWMLREIDFDYSSSGPEDDCLLHDEDHKELQVIGNVHCSPHLLEKVRHRLAPEPINEKTPTDQSEGSKSVTLTA